MHRPGWAWLPAVLLIAGGGSRAAVAQLHTCRIPIVLSSQQAPVIDGVMRAGEWKYAAALTGLISNEGPLALRQASVHYLSDGEALYVGVYCPAVPAGTAPEVARASRMTARATCSWRETTGSSSS